MKYFYFIPFDLSKDSQIRVYYLPYGSWGQPKYVLKFIKISKADEFRLEYNMRDMDLVDFARQYLQNQGYVEVTGRNQVI